MDFHESARIKNVSSIQKAPMSEESSIFFQGIYKACDIKFLQNLFLQYLVDACAILSRLFRPVCNIIRHSQVLCNITKDMLSQNILAVSNLVSCRNVQGDVDRLTWCMLAMSWRISSSRAKYASEMLLLSKCLRYLL